jgi:hypothetical protein
VQGEETLAICRSLELARAVFDVAIAEKPAGRFMIRSRTPVAAGVTEEHDQPLLFGF